LVYLCAFYAAVKMGTRSPLRRGGSLLGSRRRKEAGLNSNSRRPAEAPARLKLIASSHETTATAVSSS